VSFRAVTTSLDFSYANLARARRHVSAAEAVEPLRVLRRLHDRFLCGAVSAYTETGVEQSWNEQVFAKVLGYSSMLAHDKIPFDVTYKNDHDGRYDDFALGFFFGDGAQDHAIVSGELKGPQADQRSCFRRH
jgi:hypothetical protein